MIMDIKVPLVLFPVIELHATYVATGSVVCILPTPTLKQLLPRANFGCHVVPKKKIRKLTSKAQSKQPNFVLRLSAKCWLFLRDKTTKNGNFTAELCVSRKHFSPIR